MHRSPISRTTRTRSLLRAPASATSSPLLNKERALILLLRFSAVVMLLAVGAVGMPFSWMDAIHRQLGMGVLPNVPIVQYLTRSASALYAGYGALMLFVSFDVRRYRPVIVFKAALGLLFGAIMLVLDFAIGMPWHWSWSEGPLIIVLSFALIRLAWGFES